MYFLMIAVMPCRRSLNLNVFFENTSCTLRKINQFNCRTIRICALSHLNLSINRSVAANGNQDSSSLISGGKFKSRGKISDGTRSVIVGIVKYVRVLQKFLYNDCMVIRTMSFDTMLTALIALIVDDFLVTRRFNCLTTDSEIKFTVAHVSVCSKSARHLMRL